MNRFMKRWMDCFVFFLASGLALASVKSFAGSAYPEADKFSGRQLRTIELTSSDGSRFTLGKNFGKPLVLIPVFTSCPVTCPMILKDFQASWRDALPAISKSGAKVVVVSFDPADTRASFKNMITRQKLPRDWIYAVASPGKNFKAFESLLADLDFRYFKLTGQGGGFAHPAGAYIFDGKGTVRRFLAQAEFTREDIVDAVNGPGNILGSTTGSTTGNESVGVGSPARPSPAGVAKHLEHR